MYISYKWTIQKCSLLYLASFTYPNLDKIHLCLRCISFMQIFHCMCIHTHLFIHSSIDEHLGWSYFLAVVNNAAVNICIYLYRYILIHLGYITRSGIIGSYGNFMLNILGKYQIVFLQWLHHSIFSPEICKGSSRSISSPSSHIGIPSHPWGNYVISLTWLGIFIMTNDVEHLFICLSAFWICYLVKCLVHVFCPY